VATLIFSLLREAEALRPVRSLRIPVYRGDYGEYSLFYAPGYLCVVHPADAGWLQQIIISTALSGVPTAGDILADSRGYAIGQALFAMAVRALQEAASRHTAPFMPECLTLYPQSDCNLRCVYCQNERGFLAGAALDEELITAGAMLVAENCHRLGRTFYAVFHGGGEPLLDRRRVAGTVAVINRVAIEQGVPCFRYVATNGVLSTEDAVWLARHFDLVGLSCDGPPDIQDRQRPRRDGGTTAGAVERTARVLRQEGTHFHVRTTITSATVRRQAEIVEYLCRALAPEEIRFEPAYRGGRIADAAGLAAEQAEEFVAHFLYARRVASAQGIPLSQSGSRPAELHGPYCNVFRQVLNLTPAGWASACFDVVDATVLRRPVMIGAFSRVTGRYEIDHGAIDRLRQRLVITSDHCAGCFNDQHCVRECPDRCPLDAAANVRGSDTDGEPGFRCLVHKALAFAHLKSAADALWAAKSRSWRDADRIRAYGTSIV
jgi:sulfatase maturation enzyme AslB (radical SAM superfamily)